MSFSWHRGWHQKRKTTWSSFLSVVVHRSRLMPRRGRLEASEIPHDVCFPSTQDPFDIGSGSCAPTGSTPVAEVEGETSTPSATFSREGTLTGRPQGGQLRARTFTATALIGRYGTTPASSPKPFSGPGAHLLAEFFRSPRVYLQPIAHSTGLCSANRPHTLARTSCTLYTLCWSFRSQLQFVGEDSLHRRGSNQTPEHPFHSGRFDKNQ
ncbi:hypothetical protein E1301_Tti013620 [Triplophysa tibetana]|uniref:Uncharacterized protein n=1 Tax=Triplophysa tibetana TaxID=1572043 RepID=A0A5A9NWP6_9TELE|nr:hypothetical protein E1301_Tti013620 [Triplophysa tibetana]